MADYPAFPQLVGTEQTFADDIAADQSVSGTTKVRGFFTAKKSRFTVRHVLNADDLATLLQFYDDNRLATVTFTYKGTDYTCFLAVPKVTPSAGQWSEVVVSLAEQ